jgi:putative oxygen-independent coproporphyrinogen III oxidase
MSGIYIHIPFCKQACYYCDFHFSTSLKRKEEMVNALAKEIEMRKSELDTEIETIYFGGGTPSLMSTNEIQFLIDTIYKHFHVTENPEITLEANPDDLNESKIKKLAFSPVNRLSIGVQSFFDEDLQFMNRAHSANESVNSISIAATYFDNITIDLIYGIPKMTNERWLQNLYKAFDLNIPHISGYALTVEDKTALSNFIKKGKYPPLDEKLAQQHFYSLIRETSMNNFIQYEISNFSKEGWFSKHNSAYWQGKHYLGIGPSANSFSGKTRSWNIANNAKYIRAIGTGILPFESELLSKTDQYNETIMTGLRTIWGVSLANIENKFGVDCKNNLLQSANKYLNNKKLKITDRTLFITEEGMFFADGIASDLFLV